MLNEEKIKNEFNRIKQLGFIKSNRLSDTGIGKTFEDHLGLKENNSKDPDFDGFEVKSQRYLTGSPITLYTRRLTYPKKANGILRKTYGKKHDLYPTVDVLSASLFGNRESLVYEKWYMKTEVDREAEKVFLRIRDVNSLTCVPDDFYYDFHELKSIKLANTFVVFADAEHRQDGEYFHYQSAKIFFDFNFRKLIDCLEGGTIQYDIRCDVYRSGAKIGKFHDHGSAIRINKKDAHKLYSYYIEIG